MELLRVRNVKNFFLPHLLPYTSLQFHFLYYHSEETKHKGTIKKMEVNIYRENTFKNQQKCQLDFLIFILMAITATFFSPFLLLLKVFSLSFWCFLPWKGWVNEKGVSSNIDKSNYWYLFSKRQKIELNFLKILWR